MYISFSYLILIWLFTIYSKFYRIRVCWWQRRTSKSYMTMKTQQKTLQFFLCHFRWQMVDWLNSSSWNHWMYIYCLLLFDRPRKKLMSGPIHVKLPEMSCKRFVQIHCPIWDIFFYTMFYNSQIFITMLPGPSKILRFILGVPRRFRIKSK